MLLEEVILGIYCDCGAEWTYDYRRGDPTLPHAEISDGRCTDVYWNSGLVLSDPAAASRLASSLATRLKELNAVLPVDWVIGSAYSAITFSYELARQLGSRHGFTKKDPSDSKGQVWESRISAGARVLQCEDVITSFRTILEVRRAVEAGNPEPVSFLPDVAAIIWRPRDPGTFVIDVTALVKRTTNIWPQSECPLCKQGSPRLRPKSHWRELTGK